MKEFLKASLKGVLIGVALLGIFGGFMYSFFPRDTDTIILKSCIDMGGVGTWKKWPNGCSDVKECYMWMCIIE